MFSRHDTLKISIALLAMGLKLERPLPRKPENTKKKFPVTFSSLAPVSRIQLPLFKPLKTV